MKIDLANWLEPLITIAKNASAEILKIYYQSQQFEVKNKADHSPLTQADLKADAVIVKGLSALTPHIPVLSEEGKPIAFAERQLWEYYWCVDPLDGTREFVRRSGEFTVNIALINHHVPIFGLIYLPVTDECYYAFVDHGAYKVSAEGKRSKIEVRRWVKNQTRILASHGASDERMRQRLGFIGDYQLTKVASAWKFCWIAEGKADIYPRLGDTCEWDTAAGQCIVEQAGGLVTSLDGQRLQYNRKDSLINSAFVVIGDPRLREQLMAVKWVL